MKRIAVIIGACAMLTGLAGCSSDYIMTTKTGDMIVTQGKPEIDKDTGMTRYTDQSGVERQINTNDVAQMMEKD
ncbi:YgdI/YgdR family lipoprotein [Shimwellia pseudoproteus]|nr:YgdI/YgdR family lipoprotein [Shimwellia pseudoproteus]